MKRRGFLDAESRQDLLGIAKDGSAPHRLSRRANALLLLDDGMTCEQVARVLLVDDDTVRGWLERKECRIKLHFLPAYCPHLDPIERLWGLTHKHRTHNRCYATFKEFSAAFLTFLREDVPKKWEELRTTVTDNFRIINPEAFRVVK